MRIPPRANKIILSACVVAGLPIIVPPILAADLDRPLNDRPTVRTEIVRGINTAFNCGSTFVGKLLKEQECMIDALHRDQERHPDYRPFELGVFWGGCLQFDAEMQAELRLEKTNVIAKRDLPVTKDALKNMFRGLKDTQSDLSISDQELVRAGGDKGADAVKSLATLQRWEQDSDLRK